MTNISKDNIGRDFAIKEAFAKHFMLGIDEIVPVTRELSVYNNRKREERAAICPDRLVDDARKFLNKYHQEKKNGQTGIHAPLPMIFVAFGKDNNPIDPAKGKALPDFRMVQLGNAESEWYKIRLDHIEKRVQIAFFAHTSETAKAMTSQMRLYLQRYRNRMFPIAWHFGGYDFELTGSFDEVPVMDEVADFPERENLTVLIWNLTVHAQIPYLNAPEPAEYISDKRKGYGTVQRVNFDVNGVPLSDDIMIGVVNTNKPEPKHGEWRE